MRAPRTAALLWSGGKDSALALHHARQSHPDIRITQLVTCVSQAYDRVSMHGVRRELIRDQADALGLPVEFVTIPSHDRPTCPVAGSGPGTTFPPNDVYSTIVLAAFGRLAAGGVEVVVFGDIFLEDLRAYRDQLLAHAGLEGRYPLWGRDTGDLYAEFVALGFEAVTICVDTARLTEDHLGRALDRAFRDSLPPGVDPCGERGEYHSFTFDGPPFDRPVRFIPGDIHRHEPFAFRELFPGDSTPTGSNVVQRAGAV
ncbi:MAG: ATP-binding protein [Gemmataceae bacterium]|nr:ATP-binding protein [Gemmataceae bacterium]